jgi:hypothetical protein
VSAASQTSFGGNFEMVKLGGGASAMTDGAGTAIYDVNGQFVEYLDGNLLENGTALDSFKKQCTSNPVMCGMAVLTAAQIISTLNSQGKAQNNADLSQCNGGLCNGNTTASDPGVPTPNVATGDSPMTPVQRQMSDKANAALKDLSKQGYSYDAADNAVNTPAGEVPASSYASTDGLKKLGATDNDIKNIEQIVKSSRGSDYGAFGYDGGGGGAKSKAKGYPDANNDDFKKMMNGLLGIQEKARDVSGLQVRAGTDLVSVSSANMFEKVHNAYKKEQAQQTLYTDP